MVPDPYKTLRISHSATDAEIKHSYRELARKFHPDRAASKKKQDQTDTTAKFAAVASAYELLSDPRKKAQYDHIYKYGGFDDEYDEPFVLRHHPSSNKRAPYNHHARNEVCPPSSSSSSAPSRKRKKSSGIGYACVDPLAFIWSGGKISSKTTMAGVEIPKRFQPSSSIRIAFSSVHLTTAKSGSVTWISRTTSFCHGKKFTRVESRVLHPSHADNISNNDDRNEMVKDDTNPLETASFDHPNQRYISSSTTGNDHLRQSENHRSRSSTTPWYAVAWSGLKDKLTMCYSPSTVNL